MLVANVETPANFGMSENFNPKKIPDKPLSQNIKRQKWPSNQLISIHVRECAESINEQGVEPRSGQLTVVIVKVFFYNFQETELSDQI